MKKVILSLTVLFGVGFVLSFCLWIHHYQDLLTVVLGSLDPMKIVIHGFDQNTLEKAQTILLKQGYGKGIQHFIQDQILFHPFSIGMFLCFVGVVVMGIIYVLALCIIQKRKEEKICLALEREEEIANDPIVEKVSVIRKKYQSSIRMLALDQDSQNQELENIAHQMKSTLSTILLNVDQISALQNEEEIQTIIDQVDRCNEMLNRFLQGHEVQSNFSNYHYEVKNIADCVQAALYRVSLACEEKGLQIQTDLVDCVFSLDAFWIQESVETLLLNAVEFAYKDTKIQIKMAKKEDHVQICIINDGDEPKDIHSLFMRYGSSRKQGEHFGIGLHMVRTVCKNHLGDVYAYYASNQMHFVLDLPFNRLESIQY